MRPANCYDCENELYYIPAVRYGENSSPEEYGGNKGHDGNHRCDPCDDKHEIEFEEEMKSDLLENIFYIPTEEILKLGDNLAWLRTETENWDKK